MNDQMKLHYYAIISASISPRLLLKKKKFSGILYSVATVKERNNDMDRLKNARRIRRSATAARLRLLTLLFSIAAGTVSGAETADGLKFREWRLAAQGANAVMVAEFTGRSPAVRVEFPGIPSGQTDLNDNSATALKVKVDPVHSKSKPAASGRTRAAIMMAKHELANPLQAWIPPCIGITAAKVALAVFPQECKGDVRLFLETVRRGAAPNPRRTARREIRLRELPAGRWSEVEFAVDTDAARRLAEVRLVLSGSAEAECRFHFADARIKRQDGSEYALLNRDFPDYLAGMKKPLAAAPAKNLPKRNQLQIGYGNNWHILYDAKHLPEIGRLMKQYLPEYSIVLSCAQTPEPELAAVLPQLPENLFYQFQKAQHGIQYPMLYDALPRDWRGNQQNKRFNSIVATHPLMQRALKNQMDYAATLGVNNFLSYDYVWPYLGGRWGYDKATVAAFREDLKGKDEGLEMDFETGGPRRTIHFHDYFEELYGRRFHPRDLGLNSWEEFFPVTERAAAAPAATLETQRNFTLFLVLCHYEWLRQAQRFNQWAQSHGGTYDYVLNGECWVNGNDHIGLLRLAGTGIVAPEFFMHTPEKLETIYRGLGRYVRAGKRLNKSLGACFEVSLGGSGHPYWDLRIGYLVAYSIAALGAAPLHHDFQRAWERNNPLDKTAFHLMMAQARAFRQANLDRTEKEPGNEVLHVTLRSVGRRIDGLLSNSRILRITSQQDSWVPALIDHEIRYEQTDPSELPLLLDSARIVFLSSPVTTPRCAAQLEQWLERGGKSLLLHTTLPFRQDEGIYNSGTKPGKALFRGFRNGKPAGHTLLTDASGAPLLTRIDRGRGSAVYYLHASPVRSSSATMKQVMTSLKKELRLPVVQIAERGRNAVVLPYQSPDCRVVAVWNRKLRDEAAAGLTNWIKSRWRLKHRFFDPAAYAFRYEQPGAACSAAVNVEKPGSYRVYRFLADREELIPVREDGVLVLELRDALGELFYVAEDTPAFRKRLQKLRMERVESTPFLTEQNEKWDSRK